MKNLICLLGFYSLLLSACNNSANTDNSPMILLKYKSAVVDSLALKTAGIYGGFVPCADCEGISYLSIAKSRYDLQAGRNLL